MQGLTGWYTDYGTGQPLVILATTLARARSYAWTIDCLAPHFRVITVEMPGCGRASAPPGRWEFEDYAGWVAGFLDAMRLERATLIGHSNSGGTALVAAAMHPSRVARLILADSVGGNLEPSIPSVIVGRAIDAFFEPRLTLFGWHHVFYNAVRHPVGFFRQIWLSVHEDLRRYAAEVAAPTLVAWGRHDYTLPIRCAYALRDAIPGASLHVSNKGSHDWMIDRAAEFADVTRQFLGRPSRPHQGAPLQSRP